MSHTLRFPILWVSKSKTLLNYFYYDEQSQFYQLSLLLLNWSSNFLKFSLYKKRTLRFAWHITTLFRLAIVAILVIFNRSGHLSSRMDLYRLCVTNTVFLGLVQWQLDITVDILMLTNDIAPQERVVTNQLVTTISWWLDPYDGCCFSLNG